MDKMLVVRKTRFKKWKYLRCLSELLKLVLLSNNSEFILPVISLCNNAMFSIILLLHSVGKRISLRRFSYVDKFIFGF